MECPSCHSPTDHSQRFCKACGTMLPVDSAGEIVDPLVGKSLGGKYRIVKLLGEGGMGCVYHAEQQMGTTVRKVAVKTLHKHLSLDPKIRARFERECGTMAGLEHPNTIQVFDFGLAEDGEHLYIVMEFVQGANIADLLAQGGALPPPRVEHILRQICGSLAEAHGHGIVHRDLKPENIVLTERAGQKDFVKVLDFGIAKRSGEEDKNEQKLTQQGMVLGTPPYMSPEQFTGKPIDARSDIYSLAVMAYEMLTTRLPFEADTAWEWASQHMTAPPKPIDAQPGGDAIPERAREAIMRGLAKKPDQRFPSVDAFFEAYSSGAPTGYTQVLPQKGTALISRPAAEEAPPSFGGRGTQRVYADAVPHVASQETRARTEVGQALPDFGAAAASLPTPPPGQMAALPPQPSHPYVTPGAMVQAAAPQASGGGAGKWIALGLVGLFVVGGGVGVGVYALRKPAGATIPDAGSAPVVEAGTPEPSASHHRRKHRDAEAGDDAVDASIPQLEEPDAAVAGPVDAGKIVDAGKPWVFDAGRPVVRDAGPKVQPAECGQAALLKKLGNPGWARLAAICREKGGTPP